MEQTAWEKVPDKSAVMTYCDTYMDFLNNGKTERLCTAIARQKAEQAGFVNLEACKSLKAGDKVYQINRGKNLILARIGRSDILNGVNVIAAHIDSPRIDLKPNPLYEDQKIALWKTHYYGGIKKYQWTAIPLSLIGVVILENGTAVDICIGEKAGDPVFTITDLLPHLASDQMGKKMTEAFTGEDLNVIVGSIPGDAEKDKCKAAILQLLKKQYGIEEADFVSAELELVPANPARSVGLDCSMVGAYGQDDRVCAYTSLTALLDADIAERTQVCYLADKEEIGSIGNTGMKSRFFENFLAELAFKCRGDYNDLYLRKLLTHSACLSADVCNAVDPTYLSVSELKNAGFLGGGLAICKYTGARGKSSTSDANAEFVARVRKIFNGAGIAWQMAELGKVDQGGGGTVAQFIANLDVDTLDCGVPVLSMHAPFEVTSKADVYTAYLGYKAFYLS